MGNIGHLSEELSIMTEAPYFTDEFARLNPNYAEASRDRVIEMLTPIVTDFRSECEKGNYNFHPWVFPHGTCGKTVKHLIPILERNGFYAVRRVFETPIPSFQRVATVGDIIVDPNVDADGLTLEENTYIGPRIERYQEITTPEQFEKLILNYWRGDKILYFLNMGLFLEDKNPDGRKGLSLISQEIPKNLLEAMIMYITRKNGAMETAEYAKYYKH